MTKGLLKDSVMLTIYSMLTNVINYAYQVLASREFQVGDYGLLNTLFALSTILLIPCVSLGSVISKLVVELSVRGASDELSESVTQILIDIAILALTLLLISLLSLGVVGDLLKVSDFKVLVLLYLYTFLCYILFVFSCIAHSMRMYFVFSLFSLIPAAVRITGLFIITAAGISDEWKLSVTMGSMLLSMIMGMPLIAVVLKRTQINLLCGRLSKIAFKRPIFPVKTVGGMFTVSLCSAIMSNAVMICVRANFPEELSGIISVSMQFGNILMLGIGSFITASYPHMVKLNELKDEALGVYLQSLFLCAICSIAYCVVLYFFAENIITLLFDVKYLQSSVYLPYTVIIALFGILNSLNINYAVVKKNINVLVATYLVGLVLYLITGVMVRNDAKTVLMSFAMTMMAIYIINLLHILINHFKSGGDSKHGKI